MPGPLPPCRQFEDFLDAAEREALLDWTIANRGRFRPARLIGNVLDPTRRIAERFRDLGPLRLVFERRIAAMADDIFRGAGTTPFDIEHIEMEIAAHGDGAFFAHHSDIPVGAGRKPEGGDDSGTQDRLISAVYYYYREPKRFSGGTLRLYRFGDRRCEGDYVEVEPLQNSLAVFPSWVRHEVRLVACPDCRFEDYRFAVNIWLCRTLTARSATASSD